MNLQFFCSVCKIFTLYISRKNIGRLTLIQMSTAPNNSVEVSCTPNRLLGGFVPSWRTKLVSLKISINENSNALKTFTFLHAQYLAQRKKYCSKVDRVEYGRQKNFYVKAKEQSKHVNKLTCFLSSSNHVTVARTFTTMCPHCSSTIM